MKILTKTVIRISDGKVLESEGYDYEGPIAHCFGGGGSGGSSGKVDYPDYMEAVHADWLNATGTDTIEASITELMNAAIGSSPFSGATAYDPATPLSDAWTAVCALDTLADAMDHEVDWASAMAAATSEFEDNLIDTTYLADEVTAFAQALDDNITYQVLPKFKSGYRDANAVLSSAFAIGEAVIWGMRNRDVAKYSSELRMKLNLGKIELVTKSAEVMLNAQIARVDFEKAVAHMSVEAKRIHIVATKEEEDQQIAWDEDDALWDMKALHYGTKVMAAIAGGVSGQGTDQPSTAQSAIGGALSGAAAGAMVGGIPGAVIGGLLGLGAALLG